MIDTILFDFDGVLVNSEPLHYLSEKKLIEEYGGDLSGLDEANQATLGFSVIDTITYYKHFFQLDAAIPALLDRHDEILAGISGQSLELMDGIPGLLTLLDKNSYNYAIASSGTMQYIIQALQRLNLFSLFKDSIFCVDMVAHGKPEPDIFLYAAEKLKVSAEKCLVIEDSLNGIIAADKAGMKSLFLNKDSSVDLEQYHSKRISSISDITIALLKTF